MCFTCPFGVFFFLSMFYTDLLGIEQDSITQVFSFLPLKFENQESIVKKPEKVN